MPGTLNLYTHTLKIKIRFRTPNQLKEHKNVAMYRAQQALGRHSSLAINVFSHKVHLSFPSSFMLSIAQACQSFPSATARSLCYQWNQGFPSTPSTRGPQGACPLLPWDIIARASVKSCVSTSVSLSRLSVEVQQESPQLLQAGCWEMHCGIKPGGWSCFTHANILYIHLLLPSRLRKTHSCKVFERSC